MLSFCIIFFVFQLIVAIYLWFGNKFSNQSIKNNEITKITVLIPFKNEAKRILPLLMSINKAAQKHKNTELLSNFQFIFIDDHSIDNTTQLILNNLDISYQIIKLNNTNGKKYAIKRGVELAKFEKILTLDADVCFDVNYLDSISKVNCNGLTILPVNMKGNSFFNKLFSVEFWFLQRLTFGLGGYKKYILCNGANLLFTKSIFNTSLSIRTDADIASGDDMFLLNSVLKLKGEISVNNNQSLMVTTFAPKSIKTLLHQRIRWFKKSKDISSLIAASFVLLSNVLLVLSFMLVLKGQLFYVIPILLKVCSEFISVKGYTKKILTVVHQFYYPIYLVSVIISFPILYKSNKWR